MNLLNSPGGFWKGGIIAPRPGLVGPPPPPTNKPPVPGPDTATVFAGESVLITPLANDTDPEGGVLTLMSAGATNGNVTANEDGTLIYTPNSGFVGTDTITYIVADPKGAESQGTVTVTVTASPNLPPVTAADTANAISGQSVKIDVLANDYDPEDETLVVSEASAANGSVDIEPDGTLLYTAPAGFSGTDMITYKIVDPQGAEAIGTATVNVAAPALSIHGDGSGTFTLNAETGEISIAVTEPAKYADSYSLNVADLSGGPVNLAPPQVTGSAAEGATLTTEPGLWVYDEAFAPLGITRQWHRGGSAITNATGLTYVLTAADLAAGVTIVETATDAQGPRQVETVAFEAVETTPAPFDEQGVIFDGYSTYLRKTSDLAADQNAILYFASLEWTEGGRGRQAIATGGDERAGLYIWSGRVSMRMLLANGSSPLGNGARVIPQDTRVHILASAVPDGSGGGRWQVYSFHKGDAAWNLDGSGTIGNYVAHDLTNGGFAVGANNPKGALNRYLNARIYRFAMWAGPSVHDIVAGETARNLFLSGSGGIADPATVNATIGNPLVDLFGPAADYNSGANRGTAGNFDDKSGNFINA